MTDFPRFSEEIAKIDDMRKGESECQCTRIDGFLA